MTERTHYAELGVQEAASPAEIRTAYRRLVLLYHPDRSGDKTTTERFVRISQAYRTLSDAGLRTEYDAGLKYRRDREAERATAKQAPPRQSPQPPPKQQPRARTIGDEAAKVQQAAAFFASGKYDYAESILTLVLRTTPNDALAYAILGDISRQRGDIRQALTQYSYAVQFAPNNASYQRRYEELLEQSSKVTKHGYVEAKEARLGPTIVAAFLIALMGVIVSVSKDAPLFPDVEIINSFTFTFALLLFLSGLVTGAAAAIGGSVDRLRSLLVGASGRASPFTVVAVVGSLNFWVAALSYFATGLAKDAFTYSASRIIGAVAAVTILFVLCGWMAGVEPVQSALWAGNLVWLGALAGWAIADGFR
jgi:curved DNA-binding protein CbpA